MNIQSANLLSPASSPEPLNSQSAPSEDQGGFTSALMKQLGGLQSSSANPDLAAIQDWIDAAKNGDTPPSLQNFAAFFGKDLQSVNKLSQDIDLNDTLQTLAGVLQELQGLETGVDAAPLPSGMPELGSMPPKEIDSGTDQAALDAAVAASAVVMPAKVPVAETNELIEQTGVNSELTPVLSSSSDLRTQGAQVDGMVGGADELANRSIGAMLGREDAGGKPRQDKSNPGFNAENLLGRIESQSDAGKNLPGLAADIAKLNQTVRGETSTLPANQAAMSRHLVDPAWNKELGEKLIWMHKQAIPSVELRLNPEHLGPVLVKIDVTQDQASVAFTTQHLAVKEAIEAAMPKLREMLGGQQLNLADVNVSQQQSDQRQTPRDFFQMASEQGRNSRSDSDGNNTGATNEAQNLVDEIEAGRAIATNGLLSLYA